MVALVALLGWTQNSSTVTASGGDSNIAYVVDPFGSTASHAYSGDGFNSDLAAILFTDGSAFATNASNLYDILTSQIGADLGGYTSFTVGYMGAADLANANNGKTPPLSYWDPDYPSVTAWYDNGNLIAPDAAVTRNIGNPPRGQPDEPPFRAAIIPGSVKA